MNANPIEITQVVSEIAKSSTISLLDDMLQIDHMFLLELYESMEVCKLNSYIYLNNIHFFF